MANEELSKYIKEQLEAGVKPDDIKSALVSAGWNQVDVNATLGGFSPKKSFLKISIKAIGALVFTVAIIFYSFLGWKMTQTSNNFVNNPKAIFTKIFTWNPAELVDKIYNVWDTRYLYDGKIKPASDFANLEKLLGIAVKKDIVFAGLSNNISYDQNGKPISNSGTFLMEDGGDYYSFDYYIYGQNEKATALEIRHKVGLEIYKNPRKAEVDEINNSKIFSQASKKVIAKINFNDLITSDIDKISLSSFLGDNVIQSSNGYKVIKTIVFDNNGNIQSEPTRLPE